MQIDVGLPVVLFDRTTSLLEAGETVVVGSEKCIFTYFRSSGPLATTKTFEGPFAGLVALGWGNATAPAPTAADRASIENCNIYVARTLYMLMAPIHY